MIGVNMRRLALVFVLKGVVFASSASAATILPVALSASAAIQTDIAGAPNGSAAVRRKTELTPVRNEGASRKTQDQHAAQSSAHLDDRSVQAGLFIGGIVLLAMMLRRKRRSYSVIV